MPKKVQFDNRVMALHGVTKELLNMFKTYTKLDEDTLKLTGMDSYDFDRDDVRMVAAGIMNKLSLPYNGIYVRPLMPKFDFIGYEGKMCSDNSWYVQFFRNEELFGQSIYTTDPKQSKMEYKCMIITGMEYNSEVTPVDEITFWRTGVKLVDRHIVTHLGWHDVVTFKTPIIIGLGENDVYFDVKATLIENANVSKRSIFKLKGFVAEPLAIPVKKA